MGPDALLNLNSSVLGGDSAHRASGAPRGEMEIVLTGSVIQGIVESVRCDRRHCYLMVKNRDLVPDACLHIPLSTCDLNKLFHPLHFSFFSCKMRMPIVLR